LFAYLKKLIKLIFPWHDFFSDFSNNVSGVSGGRSLVLIINYENTHLIPPFSILLPTFSYVWDPM
jgi:hypothetical protein